MMLGLPIWKIAGICGVLAAVIAVVAAIVMIAGSRRYRFIDGRVHGVVGQMGSGKSLFFATRVLLPVCRSLSKGRTFRSSTGRPVKRIITNFHFNSPYPGVEVHVLELDGVTSVWAELRRLSEVFAVPADPASCNNGDQSLCTVHRYKRTVEVFPDPASLPEPPEGLSQTEYLWWRAEHDADWQPIGERVECWEPRLDALVGIDEMHLFASSDRMKMSTDARWVTSMMRKLNGELFWLSQSHMKVHKRLRDDSSMLWKVGRYRGPWLVLIGTNWFCARAYEPQAIERMNRKPLDSKWYRLSRKAMRLYNSFELIVPDPDAVPELQRRRLQLVTSSTEEESA